MGCSELEKKMLVERAIEARNRAYSPYCRYYVGAALLTAERKIFTGACVTNREVSICAEKIAFANAVYDGCNHFIAIAIAGGPEGEKASPEYPCKSCIGIMKEFCSSDIFQIILIGDGKSLSVPLAQLERFLPSILEKDDLASTLH